MRFFFSSIPCYTCNMPDKESITTLEAEIRALEEKLAARKQVEGNAREEKEVFRDVLKEHIEGAREHAGQNMETNGEVEQAGDAVFPPLQTNVVLHKQKADDLKEQEHHEQVEALVEIALAKGILEAVAVARHLQNPHLLDDFHDALVDEYYEKLLQARELAP